MIREITLGQYYPANSIIHRLDPRTKLALGLVYIVTLFLANSWPAYLLGVLTICAVIWISGVPFKFMIKGLKPIFIVLLISVCFNLFLTEGRTVLEIGPLTVTYEGIRQAIYMAIRLVCLILGASLVTYTTTPNQLTDGLEKGLVFLTVIKVPVHEIAMMMSIALRFIPILTEELNKIMKAQMARGADFETGNFLHRAKALVPLLVPLFISAFRRASDLASAMEARCYHGGAGRTRMHPLKYSKIDGRAYTAGLVYLAGVIALKVLL